MSVSRYLSLFARFLNSSGVLGPAGGGTGATTTPTNGQIPIGNGTNYSPGTITAGANISITNAPNSITIAASIPAGNGPAFSACAASNLSLSNGVAAKLHLDTKIFDTNNNFSVANYNFVPTVAGYYQISAGALFTTTSIFESGQIFLYKNASLYASGSNTYIAGQQIQQSVVSNLIYMNGTTDYLELYGVAYGGGSLTVVGSYPYTYMTGFLARSA